MCGIHCQGNTNFIIALCCLLDSIIVFISVHYVIEKAIAAQRKKKQKINKKRASEGIKDDNKEWLKPTSKKRKLDLSESEEDDMVGFTAYTKQMHV